MAKIFLIGMMGSGKSVTGKSLAGFLQWPFTDLDRQIEKTAGRRIAEIFKKDGEAKFRELESAELRLLETQDPLVAACGGGVVLRPENVRWLKAQGRVVYLQTGLETLWLRVKDNRDRPLLAGADPRAALEKIYRERQTFYEDAADLRVMTDGRSAADVALEIRKKLGL